ncbi:hypothetical protein BIW11_10123 [Tropilaelaps mercedesae]|uniref:Uncharacterized protein n=1 Tax=Tropilaelaps mercedesae TaxID=418985 RepID=A0A1V9XH75_9ACAR|nr:hypothetical protein BIW11_10123 [Tropilaelaps mercedesae]
MRPSYGSGPGQVEVSFACDRCNFTATCRKQFQSHVMQRTCDSGPTKCRISLSRLVRNREAVLTKHTWVIKRTDGAGSQAELDRVNSNCKLPERKLSVHDVSSQLRRSHCLLVRTEVSSEIDNAWGIAWGPCGRLGGVAFRPSGGKITQPSLDEPLCSISLPHIGTNRMNGATPTNLGRLS